MAHESRSSFDMFRAFREHRVIGWDLLGAATHRLVVEEEPHIYGYWAVALTSTAKTAVQFESLLERHLFAFPPVMIANVWYGIVQSEPGMFEYVSFTP